MVKTLFKTYYKLNRYKLEIFWIHRILFDVLYILEVILHIINEQVINSYSVHT